MTGVEIEVVFLLPEVPLITSEMSFTVAALSFSHVPSLAGAGDKDGSFKHVLTHRAKGRETSHW